MARQWIDPATGVQFHEDGTEEFIVPVAGAQFQEDQAAVADVLFQNRHDIKHGIFAQTAAGMQGVLIS